MVTRKRRCDACKRDLRGPIALTSIILVFALAGVQLLIRHPDGSVIPPWAAAFLTLVVQGYFMTKGAERHAEAMRRRDKEPVEKVGE